MTNREWLNRAFNINRDIRALQMAYMNIAADITDKSEIQKCKDETLAKIKSLTDEKLKVLSDITTAVLYVEDDFYRTLLTERYINCKPIAVIRYEQYYSERWLQKKMRKAERCVKQDI